MDDQKTTDTSGPFHGVKFYDTPESLCRIVAEFLGEGLVAQQPALIIATPEHLAGIMAELTARHFNVRAMLDAGDFVLADASTMLASIMADGMPDETLFMARLGTTIEQISRRRQGVTVRAYGEMVDVLWKNGQDEAALRMEMLWNKLARTHAFSLLCGYAMGTFYKDADLADIHQQHSHVVV
jgi:flagellar biosynthesis component FlhA